MTGHSVGQNLRMRGAILVQQPLVVDLDGTLIHTDTLHELALGALRASPFTAIQIPWLLSRGKPVLKQRLAERVRLNPDALPYNQELLAWLETQRDEGRKLILCTAADRRVADAVADHLGIFEEVIASDGITNLASANKAEALVRRFGQGGFDYVGNATADLEVWAQSRRAIVVNGSRELERLAGTHCAVEKTFPPAPRGPSVWWRVLRVHQWLKNLLLFVPLLAAHELTDPIAWASLLLAFAAFCLCASAVYIANDLMDLESDRRHPHKRRRPFASGRMPVWMGVALAPTLLLAGLALSLGVGEAFSWCLFIYFGLTCAYTWQLKRLLLIDCLTLAVLYTLRIVAGAAAVGHGLSFWLLAFSVFLFLSLAFVKRYAEMEIQLPSDDGKIHGRGYLTSDAPLVQTMGIVAGYASVLVLALYLNSEAVVRLYRSPELVWGAVPVMLFWISWMWLQAHRGHMHDDPLVFAVKDRTSLVTGMAFAAVLVAGTMGPTW